MKLSSAYLCENLENNYPIIQQGGLSGLDGYLRPFFYPESSPEWNAILRGEAPSENGHVWVLPWDSAAQEPAQGMPWEHASQKQSPIQNPEMAPVGFAVLCGHRDGGILPPEGIPYVYLRLSKEQQYIDVLNDLQRIFDRCDAWDEKVTRLLSGNDAVEKIVALASEFLENPVLLIRLDFSLVAEAGSAWIPERARLFTADGLNMEFMNALLQNEEFQKLNEEKQTVWFPAYISGFRSLNRNLYQDGRPAYRLITAECHTPLTPGSICILEALTERLEFLLSHESGAPQKNDLERIFRRILSDRTADYVEVSRQLSSLGWGTAQEYLCLILQITYLDQKNLSTKAVCRYIKRQLRDSVSFLYENEVVSFFNLTLLNMTEDQVAAKLVYFIRDSYLKAGYSRSKQGHMNLRRQYVQARTALDVGSRKKPYLWIHHFNQVALPYILEQATRRLPGTMLCHEGLLELKHLDEKNHTDYMVTLRAYLDQHLSATKAANELYIHRSTFLYRLEKIKDILQSDLENPEELFYLELSFRLLEQEEQHT